MRLLLGLIVPLILQLLAFVVVFVASRGGGSFMGLLALPVAPVALLALLALGIAGVRQKRPLVGLVATTLSVALIPPILLLVVQALES